MKYINFKRYKFSTVLKKINIKSYNLLKFNKFLDFRRYDFSKVYKYVDFKRYNFLKFYKFLDFRRYDFLKVYKYVDFKRYNFFKLYKRIDSKQQWYISLYLFGFLILSGLLYLSVPLFFNFDKSIFTNEACKQIKIKCSFQGKVKYSFFPSPRIKIKNLVLKDIADEKKILGEIENVAIKMSFYNLHNKKKIIFSKILLKDAKINLDLDDYKKYMIPLDNKNNSKHINLTKGEINFFQGQKNIATVKNINLDYFSNKKEDNLNAKGMILDDEILIKFKNNKNDINSPKIFKLKLLNSHFSTTLQIFNSEVDKNNFTGNVAIIQGKNKFISTFDYKDNQINLKKSNLTNSFLDGKVDGYIKFLPFFDFNLNVDLNRLNFNRLHSYLISLDEKNKKDLFKLSNKINGKLNLLINKIFSKHTLINSAESQLKFVNGGITIEQFLVSLGKLGAADLTGSINKNKKTVKLIFETNIFIDNLKRFYNKFGVYNKEKNPSSLFVSGNFDLENFVLHLHEISGSEEFKNEDIGYIEKEFNNILLTNDYETLFNYSLLKEFIQSITNEVN